jgi:hypothetical protein
MYENYPEIGHDRLHPNPFLFIIIILSSHLKVYKGVSKSSRTESITKHIYIYAYNNKHWMRSNTKGYGGKTHWTNSQNSDTTAPSGREVYDLQAASPETFGYTLV